MSKIFETMNKGAGEIQDLIRPLVNVPEDGSSGGSAGPVAPDSPPAVPANGTSAPPEATLGPVRTLGLRVPAPSPLLPFEDGQWQASEQYRVLRTKIVQNPKHPSMMVVSSPSPGDGKSVTAINLASTLSLKSEARVLLVDADFRKSAIHIDLGLPETPGLADVLRGECRLEEAIVNTRELANLYVLSAGTAQANPVELLDSSQWPVFCAEIRRLFRYVVIDSPPVAAVADFDLIQAPCDGVILVVRPDHTHRRLLTNSLEILSKQKLLGVVLNCVPEWFLTRNSGYGYYYYYYSGYAHGRTLAPKVRREPGEPV